MIVPRRHDTVIDSAAGIAHRRLGRDSSSRLQQKVFTTMPSDGSRSLAPLRERDQG